MFSWKHRHVYIDQRELCIRIKIELVLERAFDEEELKSVEYFELIMLLYDRYQWLYNRNGSRDRKQKLDDEREMLMRRNKKFIYKLNQYEID